MEHQEHFSVGANITENIVDAVTKSRVTLIVLSRHFLKSATCDEEYRTARYENIPLIHICTFSGYAPGCLLWLLIDLGTVFRV